MKKQYRLFPFLLLLTMLAFGCGPGGQSRQDADTKAAESHSGVLIVASKSGDDVWFIDRLSGKTLTVLPTGREPHEVEVSDDGRWAVVGNYGDRENPGNTLSAYDVESARLIRTIDLKEHTCPHGLKRINGTSHILLTTEGSQHLLRVDVSNGEILQLMETGEPVSHMVAVTPCFRLAFVPSIRTGNVAVFNLLNGERIGLVYSGAGAEGIDVHPEGHEVWITNRADNTITIMDTQSLEVLERIACADFPIRARFTPDGKLFLVSNARSGDIAVFDTQSRRQIAAIELSLPDAEDIQGRYFADFEGSPIPIGLVVPDNQTAYVANTRADLVSIIDLQTLSIKGHFPAGREPDGISFSALKPAVVQ